MDQNLRIFKKNNLYLKRYREYAFELISILSKIIIKTKKQNDIVNELSTRLNIDKEEVEKIFLNRVNKRILVTATMSAGKSTLVNALIGNKIMATSNESCTAKRFTITEDPTIGNQVIYHYENTRVRVKNDVHNILHKFKGNEINMHTKMFHMDDKYLWEIVDTPGVNSSADPDHKKLTESLIKTNNFDVLLYVMNGNHLGTHDDLQHLKFIKEHVDSKKIIFVINKVDQYRKSEDSIEESYSKCELYLNELGFTTPTIQPISAYAAFLLKKELLSKELNEDEEEEILHFKRKFNREQYDLSWYQGLSVEKSNDTKKDYWKNAECLL
ncbi:dynamin family protein [Psychrobacillus sp. NEAU-3TGS]|uniref:dynamin family protein n=1 Tax=Psychrobacillus sp. NEAU-3TGS TaxID=2995412 RepID=UPI002496C803|nr:dynamin family protein [Psychrobacillus sp. NEAU-3TGS]MDI2587629.1 dynamin family protein [Psychrobacillus sp. NEAU-3TGS]